MRSGTAVPFSFLDVKLDTDFTGSFTPEDFNKCTENLLKTVEHELKAFVNMIRPEEVKSIVLTGGSTRMPMFRDKLKRIFPQAVLKETINAEEAAVLGAVIVAQHIPPTSGDWGRLKLFKDIANPVNNEEAVAAGANTDAQHFPSESDGCKGAKQTKKEATPGEIYKTATTGCENNVQHTLPASDVCNGTKVAMEVATLRNAHKADASGGIISVSPRPNICRSGKVTKKLGTTDTGALSSCQRTAVKPKVSRRRNRKNN